MRWLRWAAFLLCLAPLQCQQSSAAAALTAALLRGDAPAVRALLAPPPPPPAELSSALATLTHAWDEALATFPAPPQQGHAALAALLLGAGANASAACPLGPLLASARARNQEALALLAGALARAPDAPAAAQRCLATPDVSGAVFLHYLAQSPAPGLARLLTAARGAPPAAAAALARALGLSALPPWPPSGVMPRAALEEAAAGAPELALLAPLLAALPGGAARASALSSRNAAGLTPLDVACSGGRVRLAQWLRAQGAEEGAAGQCAALLAASGFAPAHEAAIGALAATAAAPAAAAAAAGNASASSEGVEGVLWRHPHALPPSFSLRSHAQAGWGALGPAALAALGFPRALLTAGAAGASSSSATPLPGAVDELPLAALAPAQRARLQAAYLTPGRPFIIRAPPAAAPPAAAAAVPSPAQLAALLGGNGTLLAHGPIPYSQQYARGGGGVLLGDFLGQHMGAAAAAAAAAREGAPPPPLVFDSAVLSSGGSGGALAALHARRRGALFPAPPGLSQLILGPCRSGSALHFHPAAVNFLVLGLKAWALLPPALAGFADMHAEAWWRGQLPGLQAAHGGEGGALLQALQGPGDMLFVPAGWGHAVINLADSAAAAYEALY